MHRALKAACAVLLMLPAAAFAAPKKPAPPNDRMTVAPGVSLSFPYGWGVCAGQVLKYGPLPKSVPGVRCPGLRKSEALRFEYQLPGKPISVWAIHSDIRAVSEEALRTATPELIADISNALCEDLRAFTEAVVTSCKWEIGTVASHRAMLWRTVEFERNDPLKLKYNFRAFAVPDLTGYTFVMTATPVIIHERTDAIVAALERSIRIEELPPEVIVDAAPVVLWPVSGLSLTLPKGWIACDDATNALLGNAPDPLKAKPASCAGTEVTQLTAFDPKPLHTVSVSVFTDKGSVLNDDMVQSRGESLTESVRKEVCDAVTKPIIEQKVKIELCEVTRGSLAGHPTLVTSVVGVPPKTPLDRFAMRIVEMAHNGAYLLIQFSTPVAYLAATNPEMDAIMLSISLQPSAAETR